MSVVSLENDDLPEAKNVHVFTSSILKKKKKERRISTVQR